MTALMLNKRKRSSDAVSDSGTCQTEQTEASTPRRDVDEKYGLMCGAAVPRPLQLHLHLMHVMLTHVCYVSLQIPAAGAEAGAACSSEVAGVLHCTALSAATACPCPYLACISCMAIGCLEFHRHHTYVVGDTYL
jgi:hypothetical protein